MQAMRRRLTIPLRDGDRRATRCRRGGVAFVAAGALVAVALLAALATVGPGVASAASAAPFSPQQAELFATGGAASDGFGSRLAISGDTAVVGAPNADGTGAAYIFVRSAGVWTQEAELTAGDGATGDRFGWSVAVSGDTVVVGAPQHTVGSNAQQGAAYVFRDAGGGWTQQAELTAPDGAAWIWFGYAVAASGETVMVGAPNLDVDWGDAGSVYVFDDSGNGWTQQAKLTAGDIEWMDCFGNAIALSGQTAVIGAYGHIVGGNGGQGTAYVFADADGSWSQQAELAASDGAQGDWFGYSVALSSDTVVVGAPNHPAQQGQPRAGAAYVFSDANDSWSQQTELTASDGSADDQFGDAVAVSGGTVVVGAPNHTVGSNAQQGAAYVFSDANDSWSQQTELTASDGSADDQFGDAVAVSGGTVVVGAPNHTVGSNAQQGAAYVFSDANGSWSQQAELTASDGAAGDQFADSVALSGGIGMLGAPNRSVGSDAEQGATYLELLSPANTQAPVISGDTSLGDSLSCADGSWTGVPTVTLTYQWLRDGVAITGATEATYAITTADEGHLLSCQVSATNEAGSASATSNELLVPLAPTNAAAPVVSGDTAAGDTLSCAAGAWTGDPTPTLTYQWLSDGAAISQATNDSYTITTADEGHLLSCRVSATNEAGSLSETGNLVAVPALLGAPTAAQDPTVSGRASLGQPLSCSSGGWTGTVASLAYQWLRNGVAIPGATGNTHRVAPTDCGASLSCVVTATNVAGQTSAASNGLAVTAAPTLNLRVSPRNVTAGTTITISGTMRNSLATASTLCI